MAKLSKDLLVKNFKLDLSKFSNFDGKLELFSGDASGLGVGSVVDFETTDIRVNKYGPIEPTEIGAVKFYYDKKTFEFKGIKDELSQLNEPSDESKMTDEIKRVTGMSFSDVKGHKFDVDKIKEFFKECDFVSAHNAKFDRPLLEALVGEMRWGCSMADIDWESQSYLTRQQELLAMQCGFVYEAHRAHMDCMANLNLLLKSNNFTTFVQDIFEDKGYIEVNGYLDPYGKSELGDLLKNDQNDLGASFRFDSGNKVWLSKSKLKKKDAVAIINSIAEEYKRVYGDYSPKFSFKDS